MRMKQTLALACCAWLLAGGAVAQAGPPQAVQVPTAGLSSSPQPLQAFVFSPATATATGTTARHPAVVMVYGCGGAYGRDGKLNARHAMWGAYLAAQGYVALMLDSFSSRGFAEICTTKFSERTLKEADRVGDAYAALAYLRQLPNVDASRIAILGWSHGGGVTLDTISHRPATRTASANDAGFNAAVAFYPGCTARNKKADRFDPYAPLLLLIGEADDWTPAAPCKALAATVAARGEPMYIVTYPDTYHDFDSPALTAKRVRKDVPNGVNPGAGVTTAPNPEAREDAKLRVKAFLSDNLK
ncbi:MAG: dienelactone hydrolase family protein [Pseudomonadota bacterium]